MSGSTGPAVPPQGQSQQRQQGAAGSAPVEQPREPLPYRDDDFSKEELAAARQELKDQAGEILAKVKINKADFVKKFKKGGEYYRLIEINQAFTNAAQKDKFPGIDRLPKSDHNGGKSNSEIMKSLNDKLDTAFSTMVKIIEAENESGIADLTSKEKDAVIALPEIAQMLMNVYATVGQKADAPDGMSLSKGYDNRHVMEYEKTASDGLKLARDLFTSMSAPGSVPALAREATTLEELSNPPRMVGKFKGALQKLGLAAVLVGGAGAIGAGGVSRTTNFAADNLTKLSDEARAQGATTLADRLQQNSEQSQNTSQNANYAAIGFLIVAAAGLGGIAAGKYKEGRDNYRDWSELLRRMKYNDLPNTHASDVKGR